MQKQQRALAVSRSRVRTVTIGNALAEAMEVAARRQLEAKRRQNRATRRMTDTMMVPSMVPMPPLVERVASGTSAVHSSSDNTSPMSGADDPGGAGIKAAPLPASMDSSGDGTQAEPPPPPHATGYDSSGDEGAHKPPPLLPPELPPPLPPLPRPELQLATSTTCLISAVRPSSTPTTDEKSRMRARTTRASAPKSRGRRQSFLDLAQREEQKRHMQQERRERQCEREAMEQALIGVLTNPAVSVYDLLMAEYALQPENRAEPGVMRAGYLKQLYVDEKDRKRSSGARMQADVPRQLGVAHISSLAEVLSANCVLRELASRALNDRKIVYVDMLSGMPPFRVIKVSPDESLMMLMTRTRLELQPVLGRVPNGTREGTLQVRQSRGAGQVLLEWREREHELRTYSASKPISYRALESVASAGARLHVEGLEEKELSKMTSRSAATMHDQQNHLIQRLCAREAIGSAPLIGQWDEGSKRKKAWCVSTIVSAREQGDGSRLREVLGAKALLPDWTDKGKKKSGKNVAAAFLSSTLEFVYPDGPPASPSSEADYLALLSLTFLISDFTTSNSGKLNGSGAIIRRSVHMLSGHLLVFHAPCLSHVVHNECAQFSASFGEVERAPVSRKKKKRDDDGIISALPTMVPAILDDIVFIMERFPGLLPYLALQEGVNQISAPAVGVETRWAFYVDTVKWMEPMGRFTPLPSATCGDSYTGTCTGRLDRIINYMIDQADKRDYTGEPVSPLATSINEIASSDVRELLHELSKPRVRLALAIFQLYGTGGSTPRDEGDEGDEGDNLAHQNCLRRFLNFTQDDGEGVFFRVHRRVRSRLDYLAKLASEDEDDGGEYYEQACSPLLAYIASADGAFNGIDVRTMVRESFKTVHDFFSCGKEGFNSSPGVEFLFANPVYLAPGMLDDTGEGVLTAQELISLAKGQDPMITLSQAIADYMHVGVEATAVKEAIETHPDTPAHIFMPDIWELVIKYSKMPAGTLLKDMPELQPLHDILFRFYRFLPVSNFFSETVVKTLVKTLHPTQRRLESTASRWVSALHRDPARLARLTDSLVQWARRTLSHSKCRRVKEQSQVPTVQARGSIIGIGALLDVPIVLAHDSKDNEDNTDEEQEAEDDAEDDEVEEAEEQTEVVAMSRIGVQSGMGEHVEYLRRKVADIRSKLVVGGIISVGWGVKSGFFLAKVIVLPTSTRAYTFQVRWLDEVEPNIYELDSRWPKSSAKLKDVFEIQPLLTALGEGRWRHNVKQTVKQTIPECGLAIMTDPNP
jgi:hypothetical protein